MKTALNNLVLIGSVILSLTAQASFVDPSFNPGAGANGLVESVLEQPDGKILVSGSFSTFNGEARNSIARLNRDGSVDRTFVADPGYWVRHMALQPDGKIVIGGFFTSVAGQPRNLVARLNPNGGLDTTFNPGTGARGTLGVSITGNPDPFVFQVALQGDGKILITGNFTNYNGTAASGIARLNADGSLDRSFDFGSGLSTWGRSIQVQPNGQILVTGWFTEYRGRSHNRMVRINPDGSPDESFLPFIGDKTSIYSAARVADGKYVVTGHSINEFGLFKEDMGRLNPDGSFDKTFVGRAGDRVESVRALADGKLMIGGYFNEVDGVTRRGLARLNADGSLDESFSADTDNFVWTVSPQRDGRMLVCGGFTTISGVPRAGVARLLTTKTGVPSGGGTPPPVTPPPSDTTRPVVQITSPGAQTVRVTESSLTLTGRAQDAGGISSVRVTTDRGAVGSVTGTTAWSSVVNLEPGTNLVSVTAQDAANNTTTITRRFVYVVTSPLALAVNGSGTVSPNLNGRILEVGRGYTIAAAPAPNYIFAGWSGSISSSEARLNFVMQAGMTLQANFVPNPFLPYAGTYLGLVDDPGQIGRGSGQILVRLNGRGGYSARLVLGTAIYNFSGNFAADFTTDKHLQGGGRAPLDLHLALPDANTLQGTLTDGTFNSQVLAHRVVGGTDVRPFAGQYTITLSGPDTSKGVGYATVNVTPGGNIVIGGALPDGTQFHLGSAASREGAVPVYFSRGRLTLVGWLNLPATDSADPQGTLRLENGADNSGVDLVIAGSRYTRPASGTGAFGLNTGVISVQGGDLSSALQDAFTFTPQNRFTFAAPNENKFRLELSPGSGLFNGAFLDPATGRMTGFRGVILQRQNQGAGFFRSGTTSGLVTLGQ